MAKAAPKLKAVASLPDTFPEIEKAIDTTCAALGAALGTECYPLMTDRSIRPDMVSDVYEDLRERYGEQGDALTVVVDNGGGDINAAFNMAHVFRGYGRKKLIFVVPRWAKSAATLLACAGDQILMAPPAELGPLDPQIHYEDPERVEHYSPLHIRATLNLIRQEFKDKNDKLAEGLMARLQWPVTLGAQLQSLEIGEVYLKELLGSRMLKGKKAEATDIAKQFASGYTDHAYCINSPECITRGLNAEVLTGERLDLAWRLFRLAEKQQRIRDEEQRRAQMERIKGLPPEVLESLGIPPVDVLDQLDEPPSTPTSPNGGA